MNNHFYQYWNNFKMNDEEFYTEYEAPERKSKLEKLQADHDKSRKLLNEAIEILRQSCQCESVLQKSKPCIYCETRNKLENQL